MDAASLAALRLSVEVSLRAASVDLRQRQDDLAEAEAEVHRRKEALRAVQAEHSQWHASVTAMEGRTLSVAELREHVRRGAALAAREVEATRVSEAAQAIVARRASRVEEARREVGTQLARQRWVDASMERGALEAAKQAARREDEE